MQKGIGVHFLFFYIAFFYPCSKFIPLIFPKETSLPAQKNKKNTNTNINNEMGLIEGESLSQEKEPILYSIYITMFARFPLLNRSDFVLYIQFPLHTPSTRVPHHPPLHPSSLRFLPGFVSHLSSFSSSV